ncbi:MAG: DUF1700 domain-containing protein [Candidatus Izimaplasma sp.]|nr:DUF1700 domain-containing protein [Candidatus Izimaplasma bacterium]
MSKKQFLKRLENLLQVLEEQERQEILAFYEERFYTESTYELKTEQEIIDSLESPEVIARNVLSEYGVSAKYVKTKNERYSKTNTPQVVGILLFDLFIATWLIPVLFGITTALLGASLSIFPTATILVGNPSLTDVYTFAFMASGYVLLFLFGLVVAEAFLYVVRSLIVWHLNVFKLKKRKDYIKQVHKVSITRWLKHHKVINTVKSMTLVSAIVVGIISGIWLFSNQSSELHQYMNEDLETTTYTRDVTDDIANNNGWKIVTDLDVKDIELVVTDSTEISVMHSYRDQGDFELEFDEVEDKLIIKESTDFPHFNFVFNLEDVFFLFGKREKVRIKVPEDLAIRHALLQTDIGEVDIKNISLGELNVTATNGDINILLVNVVSDMTVKTTNGLVNIQDVESFAGELRVVTTNGLIDIDGANFTNYYITTTNGNVTLSNLNSDTQPYGNIINVRTTNGQIKLNNVYVANVTLKTTNGNIRYFNTDTSYRPNSIDYDTTNGNYESNVN